MIATFPKNAIVAEVGVARGDFSANILKITSPQLLVLIDAWAMDKRSDYGEAGYRYVLRRFEREIRKGRIRIMRGLSHEMLEMIDDDTLDWIYIDASHDYESVRRDIELAYLKVKDGGIISGHDYCRWERFGKRFGVLEAVNSFVVENKLRLIGITLENDYNWSYAIRVAKQEHNEKKVAETSGDNQ